MRKINLASRIILALSVPLMVWGLFSSFVAAPDTGMEIGVARTKITPDHPVRLTGYGDRKKVFDSVEQDLWAKALVLRQKGKTPMVWVTVDLVGFPAYFADQLYDKLAPQLKLTDRAQLAITATHTHNGPETGGLLNIFGEPLPAQQLADVYQYRTALLNTLEKTVLEAHRNAQPGKLSWAKGKSTFAMNRRVIENGKWKGFGETPSGPVDNDLPVLKAATKDGKTLALLISYACHGTTLVSSHNFIHGDWMGSAQALIEEQNPGTTVMVAIGCAGDANPSPRGELAHVRQHAESVANEINRLTSANAFTPLNTFPTAQFKRIDLTFAQVPDAAAFTVQAQAKGSPGLYARNCLEQLARGKTISGTMPYPIQTWGFGNDLAIVFLGGEVVVDYSLRIKKELGQDNVWVNAYANDVSTYIASKRLFPEGGYEVDGSMPYYDHPSRLTEDTEERIIKTVHSLMPPGFKSTPKK